MRRSWSRVCFEVRESDTTFMPRPVVHPTETGFPMSYKIEIGGVASGLTFPTGFPLFGERSDRTGDKGRERSSRGSSDTIDAWLHGRLRSPLDHTLMYVAKAQGEAELQPNAVGNDLDGETISLVAWILR